MHLKSDEKSTKYSVVKRLKSFLCLQIVYSLLFYVAGSGMDLCAAPQEPAVTGQQRLPITLKEAIIKNLLQQPAIKVSMYNIDIQKGVAQSSAGPFDPVVNSQIFHTYSRDLIDLDQNVNSLNLGQNLTPLDGIFNPLNMAAVIPTSEQANALCSCPSENSCGNLSNNEAVCPPPIHTDLQGHETTAHLDVSRRFREGSRIVFSVDIDQYNNPILCPRRLNVSRVSVEVDQPLLRNLRYGLNYMTELANKQGVNVVRYETLQTISQQVLNTITAYWNTLGARKILISQRESEERLQKIVENVKFLIQRGQLAPNDLLQPIAQLSSQIVARVQAEQAYFDAQQQLKFVMGEWNEVFPCSTKEFEVVDEFPVTALDPLSFPSIFCNLFPFVFQQRFDILASINREEVYTLLLKGAKNSELPQLDVVGRASFEEFTSCSRSEELFSSLNYKHPQKDFTVGVVFSTPFYRDEAKGLIRQRQAEWSQAVANTQLLKQQALSEISAALKDQIHIQEELKKAKEAVDEYQQLLINEKKKLVAGFSNIFFLLSFESSLTTAMVVYIQLQNQLATNIARIRFLTGTLIQYSPFNCQFFTVGDASVLPFNTISHTSDDLKGCNHDG